MNIISNQNKICAIIPFYNEKKTIAEVISRTLNFVDTVIAVDDGSTDDSSAYVNVTDNIILLKHNTNEGKGSALNTGFKTSIENNYRLTITLDADLQHPPEEIPKFIYALNEYDIVIGNRLSDLSDMPVQRIFSNKISSGLLTLKTGQKIIDSQCGFRGFRTKILDGILPHFKGYEAESEILIKAAKKKYTIGFISIPTVYGNEKSKIRGTQLIFAFLKTLFI